MMLGVGSAQLVSFVAIPILTRLYSPGQFGVLAIFSSVCMTFSVISSLRYDGAVPLPKETRDAQGLVYLSCYICLVFAFIFWGGLLFLDEKELKAVHLGSLNEYKWLLPLGSVLGSAYLIFHYWSVRQNDFKTIAKTRLSQNVSLNIVQVFLGLWNPTAWGLLLGFVVGQFFGIRILLRRFLTDTASSDKVEFNQLKALALRYQGFAKYSAPAMLINSISLTVPPIALGYIYGLEVAGCFALVHRLLAIPMNLIGNSISQVFFGEMTRLVKAESDSLKSLFYSTLIKLLFVGSLVILLGFLLKFSVVQLFGELWVGAGDYFMIMSFMYFSQLLAIPLSQVVNVFEKQRLQLVLDSVRLTLLIFVFISASYFNLSDIFAVAALSIVASFCYVFSLFSYLSIFD